jgi:hypothetical protein
MDEETRGQAQAQKWIKEKWKQGEDTPCPMCGKPDWEISPAVFLPLYRADMSPLLVAAGLGMDERGYPFVPVTCATCGHTVLLAFNSMGGDFPGISAEPKA